VGAVIVGFGGRGALRRSGEGLFIGVSGAQADRLFGKGFG
jgi:hypothetical protein